MDHPSVQQTNINDQIGGLDPLNYRIYSPIGRTISFVLKKLNLALTRT